MRVLLLDDTFTGWLGHNAAYIAAIVNELNHRNISSKVFASVKATSLKNDFTGGLQPVFRYYDGVTFLSKAQFGPAKEIDKILSLIKANWNQYEDLSRYVTHEVSDGDCIIVCMQSARTSFAYSLWLRQLSAKSINVSILLIIHNIPLKTFRYEVKALRKLIGHHHLAFAAHTSAVAEFCRQRSEITPTLLPLPHLPNLSAQLKEAASSKSSSAPITIGYFGLASEPKGFDVLVDALPHMAIPLRKGQIRFVIQATPHPSDIDAKHRCEQLVQLARELPGINVIEQTLSDSDYILGMQQADIVVIPNRAKNYKYAMSGTFAEAISLGKPVVVAEGTYMAETLTHQSKKSIFKSGDPISLAQALEYTCQALPGLAVEAIQRAKLWTNYHNAGSFVDRLLPLFKQ